MKSVPATDGDCFQPGQVWLDIEGKPIQAHGGGILLHEGAYYWFGEHKRSGEDGNFAQDGVHVYSSRDLLRWKDDGLALRVVDDPESSIASGCILERPKVIYNRASRRFVMWFHLELKGQGYHAAQTGVAVADHVTGPYTFLNASRPHAGVRPAGWHDQDPAAHRWERDFAGGQMARDMTLFVDDNGTAYHLHASEENHTLHIAELTEDYLAFSGRYARVLPGRHREAPAIFKHEGAYYLLTSGCTGWDPNPALLAVATDLFGPWRELGNPCVGVNPHNGLGPEKTFGGQSTFILPVAGLADAFIALFDEWRPHDPADGRYDWLPMRRTDDGFEIVWQDRWNLDWFNGGR